MSKTGVDLISGLPSMEMLYQKHAPMVYRRCLRLLGNPMQAEEAMQDVFVSLLRSDVKFAQHPNPGALLFRIATNTSLNLIRSSRRRPETSDSDLLMELVDSHSLDSEPTDRLFAHRILAKEEDSTRLMAIYHFIDGMTLEELAQEFKMSISGVRKRLQKFKASARQQEISHGE